MFLIPFLFTKSCHFALLNITKIICVLNTFYLPGIVLKCFTYVNIFNPPNNLIKGRQYCYFT